MKNTLTTLLFLIICYSTTAQLYKKHDWNKEPVFIELLDSEKQLASVAVKEKYLIQYYVPALGSDIKLFETKQSIIRVITDKGINIHNRVYIPTRNVKKIIDIKARVFQKNGKVKRLNKKNIKELKNVKNYGGFKIFAIEGLTKDSQLEFIYTLERYPQNLGSIIVQKNYEVREAEVIIRKPYMLNSRIKPYNGFPEMIKKKVQGNKQAFTAKISRIKAMTKEDSASPEANRMKVSYQVAASSLSDDQMWNNLENNIQSNYINIKPKKYKVLTDDYTKFTKDKSRATNSEIINNICEYINANFNIIRTRNEDLKVLKAIMKKKQATEAGILKVYSCLFNFENLNFEFVLTSNRFNHKFDPDFFSNQNLQNSLFYFIDEKKYIEPEYVNARINFAPEETISNKGVFVSSKNRRFGNIEVPNSSQNIVQRNFLITIEPKELIATINCEHQLTGYRASNSRGAYKFFKNKDMNQFKIFTAVNGIDDAEFESFEIKNDDLSLISENIPFSFNYTYKAESLVENANDDIILNFGKVIGTQNEFYQEAERVNPVELRSLIIYKYVIKINIPNGYEAKGLEDTNIHKTLLINDKPACSFVSEYSVNENTITISVKESYDKLSMDLKYYEGYKNVVNAAFDFSKKSVLFKKL